MVALLRQDASILRDMHKAGKSDKVLREEKTKMLAEAYRIIALNFGVPPEKFVWRYEGKDSIVVAPKEYTPKQFYQELVGFDLNEFVPIFNYPGKDYFKLYRLDQSRGMFDKQDFTFINLPIDSLKRYSLASVLNDEPVYFACDVGKDNYGKQGILQTGIYDFNSVYGTKVTLTKQQQIDYYQSTPDHAMLFTGVDTANGKATKWKVENSWGTARGDNGWWTMYDDWYSDYVYVAIINKKYLPKEVTAILETKPTILPVWDPMYDSMRRMDSGKTQ
jgi:bleomycin hydrolase